MVAAFVLSVVSQVTMLVNNNRTQKRQVSLTENAATVPQVQKVEGEVARVDAEVKALKDAIQSNGEIRRKNIEAKVESVRLELKEDIACLREETTVMAKEVSALAKNCELTNASVNGLGAQITRMLERGVGMFHREESHRGVPFEGRTGL